MRDFFETANSLESTPIELQDIFESIYGWIPKTKVFLGINLRWPKFDLPINYQQYFLSWHTEQFDLQWAREQCLRVYPHSVMIANDGIVDPTIFPDNVEFVQWITWGEQLTQLVNEFGICSDPTLPKYKISSLSFRISQYKNYVTAYLLQHADPNELVLTYHNQLGKPEDLHGYPSGCPWLDALDFLLLKPTWINFQDNFDWAKNTPVANGNWQSVPYRSALVNCTNESFHYSSSQYNGQSFIYPAPYLTEKTWKPLLASRPFLSVGQYNINKTLRELGLSTKFGFPEDFDSDSGDLTRIRSIFQTIDVILKTSTKDLYEQSYDAVTHNAQIIKNGEFASICSKKNEQARGRIQDFLSV